MPPTRSEDRSSFSDPSDPSSQGMSGLAANLDHRLPLANPNGDLNDDDLEAEIAAEDPLPPLGAKLTCYRLFNLTAVIVCAIPKAILSYENRSVTVTTFDLLAALCGGALFWVGLFEERRRGWKWKLFYQVDLAPAIGRSAKHFFEGVVSVLSVPCNALVILPLVIICLLSVIFLHLPRQGEFDPIERTVGGFFLLLILLVFYS